MVNAIKNVTQAGASLDTFTRAYIEAALWSSLDDKDRPMDANYSASDLADETLAQFKTDCAKFQAEQAGLIVAREERAGHDFWLTRNGHGAGFWDGDWPESEDKILTDAAHAFGSCELYVGDDGKIYC
jgi:hypothetical protein